MGWPASLAFCPVLEEMIAGGQLTGRSGKIFNGLGALSTRNNLLAIRTLMMSEQPMCTLEIGMAFGGSALTFASCHRDLGRPPGQQHLAMDNAQSDGWDDVGRLALERAGLLEYVEIREELSFNGLPKLAERQPKFGMIYLDGSHQFEDVFIDFFYSHEMLAVGGLILFDDSPDSHVQKVIRFVESNYTPTIYERLMISPTAPTLYGRLRQRAARALRRNQLTVFRKLKDGRQNWTGRLAHF